MNVLIVEDSPRLSDQLREALLQREADVRQASTLEDARLVLAGFWPDVVILDANFPAVADSGADFNAPGVLSALEERGEENRPSVVLMSGDDRTARHFDAIRDWWRTGRVDDVVPKNVEGGWEFFRELLLHRVELAVSQSSRTDAEDNDRNREWLRSCGILSREESMLRVAATLRRIIAQTGNKTSVLIMGANGTGKGLIARAIHHEMCAKHPKLPFTLVHCGALQESTARSELFGHVRGAFTGAEKNQPGKLEEAGEGVLFLDDIHHLPPSLMAALLSPLQDRVFYRMGSSQPIEFKARVVSSTNVDPVTLCKENRLSEEFYNRIAKTAVFLPALAQRPRDIEEIAFELALRMPGSKHLRPDALRVLQNYHWPGNVRQLEGVIETVRALHSGESVTLADLRALSITYLGEPIDWGNAAVQSVSDGLLRRFGWLKGWASLGGDEEALVFSWLQSVLSDSSRLDVLRTSLKYRSAPKPIHFYKALLFAALSPEGNISHKMFEQALGLGWDYTNRVACYLAGIQVEVTAGLASPLLVRANTRGKYSYSLAPELCRRR